MGGEPQDACPDAPYSPAFPAFEPTRRWVCFDPDKDPDNRYYNDYGCGSGCEGCDDYPTALFSPLSGQAYDEGSRFLRPARSGQIRNAEGYYSDLRSNHPQRVPRTIVYERATCWENNGTECFQDYCGCQPPPHVILGTGTCGGPRNSPVPIGELFSGQLPDCVGVTDAQVLWPKNDGGSYDCRDVLTQHNPTRVPLSSGKLLDPVFHRDHGCSANAMVLATAKIAGSACGAGFINSEWVESNCNDPSLCYYGDQLDPEARQRFDTMAITTNTAAIADDPSLAPGLRATIAIKNAILTHVASGAFPNLLFDQLRNRVINEGNGALGHWRQTYEGIEPRPQVATFHMRGANGGDLIPVTMHIRKVWFEVYLFVLRKAAATSDPFLYHEEWWPYARARIRAWTEVRTSGGEPAAGSFYLKDGVPFVPPGYVEWRGSLGAFSTPPTANILRWNDAIGGPDFKCPVVPELNDLARLLAGTRIPAMVGANHTGDVRFQFARGGSCS